MPIRPVPIASLVATLLLGAPAIFAQHIMLVPGPTVIHSVVPDDIDAAKFEAALPRVLRARPELIRFALKKADAERVAAATAAITTAERVVYLRLLEAQPSAPILGSPRALAEMFDGGFCRQSRGRIAALIKVRPDVRVVMMTPNLSPDNVLLDGSALVAETQGKFAAIHDAPFSGPLHQDTNDATLFALARATDADSPREKTEMTSNALNARINAMVRGWTTLGRTGTPSFLMSKRWTEGAVPLKTIETSLPAQKRTS